MNYTYRRIKQAEIGLIKPLWTKLNNMHYQRSRHFKEHFLNTSFEHRCQQLSGMDPDNIFIEVIINNDQAIGYCISTRTKETGEIESIYIEREYRKYGLGKQLIENSLQWLKSKGCSRIKVGVAEGNESVYGFYRRMDFFPRMTYLELKE